MEEKTQFLTVSASVPGANVPSAIAHRKRTSSANTLNSWHSTIDLNPEIVIRDDDKGDEGDKEDGGVIPGVNRSTPLAVSTSTQSGDSMPVAPDGGWGWMCVLGCSVIHFILGGIGKSYGLIHVALTESLEATDFAVSWIHALTVCCRMCMGPLASMLFAKGFSCRQVGATAGVEVVLNDTVCGKRHRVMTK